MQVNALRELLATVAPALSFSIGLRMAPFGVAALVADNMPKGGRSTVLATTMAALAILILGWPRPAVFWLVLAAVYAYFMLVSLAVWSLSGRVVLKAPVLFFVSLVTSLVVPGMFLTGSIRMVAVVLGFEHCFSVYSYWWERQAGRAKGDLGDCLMFLLVNPTLVYPERGVWTPEPVPWVGVSVRVIGAVMLLLVHYALMQVLPAAPIMERSMFGHLTLMLGGLVWLQLVVWYMVHSATASLQISIMRGLGWKIPERYRYPLLARSPGDFWRRWNTYLGLWFYKYVFLPVGLGIARLRVVGPDAGKVFAVMAAFTMCGAMHELSTVMGGHFATGGALLAFLFGGTVLVIWTVLARSWRRFRNRRTSGPWGGMVEQAGRALSPLVMLGLITVLGSFFLPGLAGRTSSAETRR